MKVRAIQHKKERVDGNMQKIYAIRVRYKNGQNQLLKFGKHKAMRNMKFLKLKNDKSTEEVVPVEIWE